MNYVRVPNDIRQRIITSHQRGESVRNIATWMEVPQANVRAIIRKFETTGRTERLPMGGNNPRKLTRESKDFLVMIVEANPFLTLDQINAEFRNQTNINVCRSTIANALDGELITLKIATKDADVNELRNTPENIETRAQFANWFINLPPETVIVYVDESGYNIHCRRTQGRALIGRRVRRVVHAQRGQALNVILGISPITGLVYYESKHGTVDGPNFQEYINNLCRNLPNQNGERCVVIMDGARIHGNIVVPEEFQDLVTLRVLPPYSPFLNPCENAFSCFKFSVKRQLVDPQLQAELAHPPEGTNMGQWRLMILERCAVIGMNEITALKCAGWYRKMMGYIPDCLNSVPIIYQP